jgi:hypothetical protein
LRPGEKKAARNAPKCHCSSFYRAGVVVFVVAQPIQDLSAVSITHKTVGIRLPRLRCGAIRWFVPALQIIQNSCLLDSPFVMVVVGGWGRSGVFESAKKTE